MFFFLQLPFILGYAVFEIFANPQEFITNIFEDPETFFGGIAAIGNMFVLFAQSFIEALIG